MRGLASDSCAFHAVPACGSVPAHGFNRALGGRRLVKALLQVLPGGCISSGWACGGTYAAAAGDPVDPVDPTDLWEDPLDPLVDLTDPLNLGQQASMLPLHSCGR